MIDKRFEGSHEHHDNATHFIHKLDKFCTAATLSCPLDTVITNNGEFKDYPELFKIEDGALVDETQAKLVVQAAFKFVKARKANVTEQRTNYLEKKDHDLFDQKYTVLEGETQYQNVLDALTNAGHIEEVEQEKKEDEAPMMEAAEGEMMEDESTMMEAEMEDSPEMMEGGEPAIQDIEDYFKLSQYENDSEDYSGSANIAKLLLKQTIVNPIFGDALKKEVFYYCKDPYSYDNNYDSCKLTEIGYAFHG